MKTAWWLVLVLEALLAVPGYALNPGVGYVPPSGFCQWQASGGGGGGLTTPFNPAAPNPFRGAIVDDAAFAARYGGRRPLINGSAASFRVDAETILGALGVAMHKGFLDGLFGSPLEYDGNASLVELHDFACVDPAGAIALQVRYGIGQGAAGASQKPGQPAIIRISSPAPGQVSLAWRTRQEPYRFLVLAAWEGGSETYPFGEVREAVVTLPPGVSGVVAFRVKAVLGETPGAWSLLKRVTVEAGAALPPPDPLPPQVDPAPDEPPPAPVAEPQCWLLRIEEQSPTLAAIPCPPG